MAILSSSVDVSMVAVEVIKVPIGDSSVDLSVEHSVVANDATVLVVVIEAVFG